jgi:type IV pilus assembly protein PilC
MPRFSCRIGTPTGSLRTQEVEEDNPETARRALEARGYFVFRVEGSAETPRRPSFLQFSRHRSVRLQALVVFNQELLALIKAGLPILTALDLLGERSQQPQLRSVLAEAREAVKGGMALSVAMAQHPRIFSALYTGALQAGEQSGNLVDALSRFLDYQKRIMALRQRFRAALTYPAALFLLAGLVIVFLLTYVVPHFTQIYGDMDSELPAATRLLVTLTQHLQGALPVAGGIAALLMLGMWRWWKSPGGRRWIDRWTLHLPFVGDLLRGYLYSRFARTLAMTLGGGIPMIPSLEATFGTLGNAYLTDKLRPAISRVTAGTTLADALERSGVVPPLLLEMVTVGESSGSLQDMLGHVADLYDAEMDTRLTSLAAVIEPIIMVGMGLIVATIVIIMYLPIFHLYQVVH